MNSPLRKCVCLFLVVLTLGLPVWAAESDTSKYLQLIEKTKDLSPEQQLRSLRQFLQDNPDMSFDIKEEINSNIVNLQKFVNESDPQKKKEKKDADTYMKALSFSQKLTVVDQEALWDQFLTEHPDSFYSPEARSKLLDLRRRLGLNADGTKIKTNVPKDITDAPVATHLNYKNPDTALLLSTFAGLIVPGMAHWYTHDYVIAGLLTALRVVGGISFINGYVTETDSYIILGSILAGASYFGDIADSTFSVDRYNEALEKKKGLALAYHFKF